MKRRSPAADLWMLEGYQLTGHAHVVSWSRFSDITGPLALVIKHAGRGAGWLRFGRKIARAGRPGWDVTWYRTRGAAERGMFALAGR